MRDAFYLPSKYSCRCFFFVIKCPYAHKFKVLQIRKIPSLVGSHSLYQFLHSQVYCNRLILIYNVKICIDIYDWLTSGYKVTQLNIYEVVKNVCWQKSTNDTKEKLHALG